MGSPSAEEGVDLKTTTEAAVNVVTSLLPRRKEWI